MIRVLRRFHLLRQSVVKRYDAISEKVKGGRIEKWGMYWKGVYLDYKEVFVEVTKEAKSKPKKTLAIATAFTLCTIAFKTNPDEFAFRNQLLTNANQVLLVSDELRNPMSSEHVHFLTRCYNEGLLRTINLGFFSLLWIDNYDRAVALYAAQCSYLRPAFTDFHTRILDVGVFGKWHVLDSKLKDYDINPREWESIQ